MPVPRIPAGMNAGARELLTTCGSASIERILVACPRGVRCMIRSRSEDPKKPLSALIALVAPDLKNKPFSALFVIVFFTFLDQRQSCS